MKRTLKKSEKLLLTLCGGVVALVGVWFYWSDHSSRLAVAQEKIDNLQPRFTAALAAAADAPFWRERQAWLNATLPDMGDSGEAHSALLEQLQTTARERGLALTSPVLLKPEGTAHFRDLSVNLQITGPDNAVHRWLAELQSPEKFQLVKYLLLTPAAATPPRLTATVTVARLYKP
jgi:Tfp pilus assembly protein PilO